MDVPKVPKQRFKARQQRIGSLDHPYKGVSRKLAMPKSENTSDLDDSALSSRVPMNKSAPLKPPKMKKLSPSPSQFKKLSRKF